MGAIRDPFKIVLRKMQCTYHQTSQHNVDESLITPKVCQSSIKCQRTSNIENFPIVWNVWIDQERLDTINDTNKDQMQQFQELGSHQTSFQSGSDVNIIVRDTQIPVVVGVVSLECHGRWYAHR